MQMRMIGRDTCIRYDWPSRLSKTVVAHVKKPWEKKDKTSFYLNSREVKLVE